MNNCLFGCSVEERDESFFSLHGSVPGGLCYSTVVVLSAGVGEKKKNRTSQISIFFIERKHRLENVFKYQIISCYLFKLE